MMATIICSLICLIDYRNYILKRLSTLTLQFYKLLLLYNIVFSTLAIFIIALGTGFVSVGVFLFAKLIGFGSAVGLQYFFSKDSYFYFRNAGFEMRRIILSALVLDIFFCLLLTQLSTLIIACLR